MKIQQIVSFLISTEQIGLINGPTNPQVVYATSMNLYGQTYIKQIGSPDKPRGKNL